MILTILGGDSVSTPVLIREIATAFEPERLSVLEIRLQGRNRSRMNGILEYAQSRFAELNVSVHTDAREAARHSSHILCQVRPGGMVGRSADERLALRYGTPADEGLGLGGVAAYLRGFPVLDELLSSCASVSKDAEVFMMTAPLGPTTRLADRYFPGRAYGVCELPGVIAQSVCGQARDGGLEIATHDTAGVNHCSWLYNFRDVNGRDVTPEVIELLSSEVLGLKAKHAKEYGAVPMHYLRLFFEPAEVLREQYASTETRGEHLDRWREEVHQLLIDPSSSPLLIEQKLALRRNDWYRHGIVPALLTMTSAVSRRIVLNIPNAGLLSQLPDDAIVEAAVFGSQGGVDRLPLALLPDRPAELTVRLVEFETRLTGLPMAPSPADLEEVLSVHPFLTSIPTKVVSRELVAQVRHDHTGS